MLVMGDVTGQAFIPAMQPEMFIPAMQPEMLMFNFMFNLKFNLSQPCNLKCTHVGF